jgi:hypothetical protein
MVKPKKTKLNVIGPVVISIKMNSNVRVVLSEHRL